VEQGAIDVPTPRAPSDVPVGGTVAYTIAVTNTGTDVLDGITVDDAVLGSLNSSFADSLAPGASESHDFDHVVTADDPDPLVNTVDVSATGADSGDTATDTASCSTNVTHEAGINVEKPCAASDVTVGWTVTYTITV